MRASSVYYNCKAKYIPNPDGGLRLASVQQFSIPKFRPSGWEDREKKTVLNTERHEKNYNPYDDDFESCFEDLPDDVNIDDVVAEMRNTCRAVRRAKLAAMDYILCNPELDIFVTLTYGDNENINRIDYDECYKVLKNWLSNRVSRNRLLYVAVCERQKKGGIHFHILCNSSALSLVRAHSPYTGKPLTHHGKALYNISDWTTGFSSAEYISGDNCRDKVAKYIFKYMSKESFSKIGGRYFLHGGKLKKPVYAYGDNAEEFFHDEAKCVHEREVHITDELIWTEWSFV